MNPRPLLILASVLIVGFGIAIGAGWIRDDTEAVRAIDPQPIGANAAEYRRELLWSVALIDGVKEDGPHDVFVRRFAREGWLALCGYLVRRDFNSDRAVRWLDQAKLEIAGHRLPARFIAVLGQGAQPEKEQAGCIATDIAFDPAMAAAEIKFTAAPLIESRK